MNSLFLNALVWHILLGIAAIVAFAGLQLLLRGKELNIRMIKIFSLLGFLGFLGSWIFGGYYYVAYYGKAVKSQILKSADPWAHNILMESKEHVFLFLPFLAFVVFILVNLLPKDVIENEQFRKSLSLLCFVIVALGIIITLSGIGISGSVVAGKP